MKLINSGLEILEQQPGLDGIYKQIELAGRTCYKSEDKITEDSAKTFVDRMIKSGHGAMLEHGTVYLRIPNDDINYHHYLAKYDKNPYSRCNYGLTLNGAPIGDICITTNYRVIVENNWLDDLKYICEPTKSHEKRVTVKWTCDRVTGESFLRHRVFSFARESTRYCNYSKDKFGNEIKFIIPTWIKDIPNNTVLNGLEETFNFIWTDLTKPDVRLKVSEYTKTFLHTAINSELGYLNLIQNEYKPQQARQVLPFSVHSPLVMTGFLSDWTHFFELRCAPSAHPDAQKLAKELLVKLHEMYPGKFNELYNKYIEDETESKAN